MPDTSNCREGPGTAREEDIQRQKAEKVSGVMETEGIVFKTPIKRRASHSDEISHAKRVDRDTDNLDFGSDDDFSDPGAGFKSQSDCPSRSCEVEDIKLFFFTNDKEYVRYARFRNLEQFLDKAKCFTSGVFFENTG